jgi:hypothetical protein
VELRISFTPTEHAARETWTLHVLSGPETLRFRRNLNGEIGGLPRPDFDELDRRMQERGAGYYRRLLPTDAIEIAATSEVAKSVLVDWILRTAT